MRTNAGLRGSRGSWPCAKVENAQTTGGRVTCGPISVPAEITFGHARVRFALHATERMAGKLKKVPTCAYRREWGSTSPALPMTSGRRPLAAARWLQRPRPSAPNTPAHSGERGKKCNPKAAIGLGDRDIGTAPPLRLPFLRGIGVALRMRTTF